MTEEQEAAATEEDSESLAEGTLLSHLIELRGRLLKIAAAVVVVFVALLPFSTRIFTLVSEPLREVLPGGAMIATQVASPLLTPFKMTFFVALFVAMPVVLYQIWAFVAPGLYKKEKRFAMPLLASSIILFYMGIAFAFFVVFPLMFNFFTAVAPEGVEVQTDISQFLDFITTIIFAFARSMDRPDVARKTVESTTLRLPDGIHRRHVPDAAGRDQPDPACGSGVPALRTRHPHVENFRHQGRGRGTGQGA